MPEELYYTSDRPRVVCFEHCHDFMRQNKKVNLFFYDTVDSVWRRVCKYDYAWVRDSPISLALLLSRTSLFLFTAILEII